jgi:hypothetical protein
VPSLLPAVLVTSAPDISRLLVRLGDTASGIGQVDGAGQGAAHRLRAGARGCPCRSTVRVWARPTGRLPGPPLTSSQVMCQAVRAAAATATALGVVLLGRGGAGALGAGPARLAASDAEWRATEPAMDQPTLTRRRRLPAAR